MKVHLSKRLLALLLTLVLILSVLPAVLADEPEPEQSDDIVVLFTNDVHCGVDQNEKSIGIAGLAKVKKEMQAAYRHVTLVDNGDAIQGELIGTISNGEYLVRLMNFVGYDYATFGNHEFDYTMPQLKKLVDLAACKYLSCNFKYLGTDENPDAVNADSYAIKDYDGLKVAFVGITTPESLVKSTPTYFQDADGNWIYTFCNDKTGEQLYAAVQAAVDAARGEGAQVVVAMAHLGIDEQSAPWRSTDVLANTTGIDVMLDGHSHSVIARQEVANKDGNTVLLASTGTKLANIGKLTITRAGAVNTELLARADVDGVDADTQDYLDTINEQFAALKQQVVAHVDYNLLTKNPETGNRMVRLRETNLGNVCADAYRTVLDADIAFVNGGGVRADIPAGDVTYEQIINVHPYGNMACKVKTTGQQILDALEMASRTTKLDRYGVYSGENGGFLQVSGLQYTIDSNIPSSVVLDEAGMFESVTGERRVKDVIVQNRDGSWEPIDPEGTYTLASHNYMLKQSGDGINMFRNDELLLDEVKVDNQVLIEYMTSDAFAEHNYSNWEGEGRITVEQMFLFDDVSDPNKYYFTPVYWAYDHDPQITAGTTPTTFGPKALCTRGQAVTFLWKAMGEPEPTITSTSFTDVPEDAYYYKPVLWAVESGVTGGKTPTTFAPKASCTRREFVTFLWSAMGKPEPTAESMAFTDVPADAYYYKPVLWAVENGITAGKTPTTFAPKDNCTRGEFVTFLYKTFTATPVENDFAFLVTSDLHGQIYATDYTLPYAQSGTYKRGLTRIATYIKEQKAALADNVYVVDMGDIFQGAPLTYYYAFNKPEEKDPAILALRTIGYDMWVVGNHEFNYGLPILTRQMDYAVSEASETEKQLTISMANYLKAETNNAETRDWATWRDVTPYVIKDFNGCKVAVIGFGNPNVPKWDVPANWEGIYFADILETYQHYEAEMLEQADMIVVVAHSGIGSDEGSDFMERLVNATNTIDFAFSGHEHGRQIYYAENADGKKVPILQPYTKARAIAQVGVKVVTDKIHGTSETTIAPEIKDMEGYSIDESLAELLKPYETDVWENYMLQPIGKALGNYPAANLGTAPSAFMDLINTVQTWGAYDRTGENTPDKTDDDTPAMLSISAPLTSGDKENLIAEGDINLGDMFGLYRFENWFYQITMTGEEVHQWLEFAATKIKVDEAGEPYVTNSDLTYYDVIMGEGFHYEIDVSRPEGERVVVMTYNGEPVTSDQPFTVVVNNYRYNGGGNYVKWLNDHGCEFVPNDPARIIYSTQYDMLQGEDEGQARALLVSYIKDQTAQNGGITPFISSDWTVTNGTEVPPQEDGFYGNRMEVVQGDKVIIYHPESGKAMSDKVKGKTLEGVAGSAHHGMLEPGAGTATFTVEYPEGDDVNFYLKLADGTYLTSGPTDNELKLEATPNEYSLWYLQVKSEDDGTVFVRSTNAVYGSGESAKPQALEFYKDAFTTYGWSDKAAFIFQLYVFIPE